MIFRNVLALFALLATPVAAFAAEGTQVPEAPSGVLFALGLAGVLIGRHISRRRGK